MTKTFKTTGKSLNELRKEYGVGSGGFFCNDWWLTEKFADEYPEVGTYEVDWMKPEKKMWDEQVKDLKEGFKPMHPAVLAEIILSHFKKTGERLCEDWYSRTSAVDSVGDRVVVGYFDSGGLSVYYDAWDGSRGVSLGVASARKSGILNTRGIEPLESLRILSIMVEIGGKRMEFVPSGLKEEEKG